MAGSRVRGVWISKGADVQLINEQIIQRRSAEAITAPVECGGVVNDGIATGRRNTFAIAWVAFPDASVDKVFIFLSRECAGDICRPSAVRDFAYQTVCRRRPAVELAGNGNVRSIWRPNAKCYTGLISNPIRNR